MLGGGGEEKKVGFLFLLGKKKNRVDMARRPRGPVPLQPVRARENANNRLPTKGGGKKALAFSFFFRQKKEANSRREVEIPDDPPLLQEKKKK